MPFFTIILPTYNRANFLPSAINSMVEQTFTDWELIIIDDGSTDNTADVVKNFSDHRIKYYYQKNSERSAARNNGLKHSTGTYICFLDSDDYYLPSRLHNLYEGINKTCKPVAFFYTNAIKEIGIKREIVKVCEHYNENPQMLFENIITPIMVCIHRRVFDKHVFLENYISAFWEDTHLWIRIALDFPVFYIEDNSCIQVEHDNRSINKIEKHILRKRYIDHIHMVEDLFNNYKSQLSKIVDPSFYKNYVDNRHRLFLYLSRTSRFLSLSLFIWWRAILNKPSLYLIKELPNIALNKLGLKTK